MFGYPAELGRAARLCDARGMELIEDCRRADGGTLRDGSPARHRGARLLLLLLQDPARRSARAASSSPTTTSSPHGPLAALPRDDLGAPGIATAATPRPTTSPTSASTTGSTSRAPRSRWRGSAGSTRRSPGSAGSPAPTASASARSTASRSPSPTRASTVAGHFAFPVLVADRDDTGPVRATAMQRAACRRPSTRR